MTGRSHPGWALLGLGLALASVPLAFSAGLGYRAQWWTFRDGFRILTAAVALGGLGAAFSLIAALANWGLHRIATARAVAGLAIGLAMVVVPLQWKLAADRLPRIHDITSDPEDPPAFVEVARLRTPGDHAVTYDGATLAIRQKAAYPDIRPLHTRHDVARTLRAVRATLDDMGLRVVGESAADGRLEAVDRTLLFGFTDDLVVRVRAGLSGGTRVDARSMSRVGISDLGQNAKRLRAFFARLRARLPD